MFYGAQESEELENKVACTLSLFSQCQSQMLSQSPPPWTPWPLETKDSDNTSVERGADMVG